MPHNVHHYCSIFGKKVLSNEKSISNGHMQIIQIAKYNLYLLSLLMKTMR